MSRTTARGTAAPKARPTIRTMLALRARQVRNLLTIAPGLARAFPMVLGGDEIGRTQGGNNNAYCQDNEVSWTDWDEADPDLLEFTRRLIRLRTEHPSLRRRGVVLAEIHRTNADLPDSAWFTPEGEEMDHRALARAGPPLRGPLPQRTSDGAP